MNKQKIKLIIEDVTDHLELSQYDQIDLLVFTRLVNLLVNYQIDKEGYDFISCEPIKTIDGRMFYGFNFIGIKNGTNPRTRTVLMTYELSDEELERVNKLIW